MVLMTLAIQFSIFKAHSEHCGQSVLVVTSVSHSPMLQMMKIDVSSVGHSGKSRIDTAVKIYYTPPKTDHLLVVTGNNKLFKFDARNGRILSEVSNTK